MYTISSTGKVFTESDFKLKLNLNCNGTIHLFPDSFETGIFVSDLTSEDIKLLTKRT